MKQKILWVFIFISSLVFSQAPSNGVVAEYLFTNTNYLDDGVNNANFTQAGTSLIQIPDRFGNVNKAINLSTSFLTRPDINLVTNVGNVTNAVSYSFWVKTTTNDNALNRTIIDDSDRSSNVNMNGLGYAIRLQRGKILASSKVRFPNGSGGYSYVDRHTESTFVADGKWHHIVVRFAVYRPSGAIRQNSLADIYVDGRLTGSQNVSIATPYVIIEGLNTTGKVSVGNMRNANILSAGYRYADNIDDVYIYERLLNQTEINNLGQAGGAFCFVPETSKLLLHSNTITANSAQFTIQYAGDFDVAYHKVGQSFSNAIITSVTSTGSNVETLTGLDDFTQYKVYYRKKCSSSLKSEWSTPKTLATLPVGAIYVDKNATGANNGRSWSDAFTDLHNALSLVPVNGEIWIKGGTYTPDVPNGDIEKYFNITKAGLKIYGGFAGTESDLSQRVLGTNPTIISGDLDANDTALDPVNYSTNYNNVSRNNKNSRILVRIKPSANDILLDGLTFTGAHNTHASEGGGAIVKYKQVKKLTIRNCIIEKNVSQNGNAGLLVPYELGNVRQTFSNRGILVIENSEIKQNFSTYATGIYSIISDETRVHIFLKNMLFANNSAVDLNTSRRGLAGSSAWFRLLGSTSTSAADVRLNVLNCTFAKNRDRGSNANGNTNRATLIASRQSANSGDYVLNVSNSIFYHNENTGGMAGGVSTMGGHLPTGRGFYNSIDPTNFTGTFVNATTLRQNCTTADPKFTNVAIGDYTLQSTSSAIDSGDNTKVASSMITDLAGNSRIHNTTVDRGCYEYGSTPPVYRSLNITSTNGIVTANPQPLSNGSYLDGTIVTLTATPNANYVFDNWSVTPNANYTSSNGSTATVTLNSDTNVTANFNVIPRPTPSFTNLPQGNTTTGDFTSKIEFNSQSGVTGFTLSDIQVTGATLSNFTVVNANEYTFKVTPSDVCAGTPITLKVPENVAFDVNNTSLGNTASSLKTITVKENVKPTVKTQNLTVQLNANGNVTITASQINDGSTDNCSIASMSLDKTNFGCSDLGSNTVELTVTDTAGNSDTATATVTVEDKIAPTVTTQNVTVVLNGNNQASITASDVLNTVTDNCTASGNLTTVLSKSTFDCTNLGANTINVEVTDASGNKTTETAVVTVNPNPNNTFKAIAKNITVQLDANGQVSITPQNVDNGSGSGCNSNPTLSLDITSFGCSNIGTNNVVLTATDGTNTATANAVVTVEDKIAPTVKTQDVTVELDASGNVTITASQINDGSTDNCSIASMSLDKTSFGCADLGSNTVELTVTDTAGNSVKKTATVTVEDKIAPTVTTQNVTVALNGNNQAIITVSDVLNTATDNCTASTNLTTVLSKSTFDCTNLGANTINVEVTDANGNKATETAVVTVNPNPNTVFAAVAKNITVQLDANGQASITPQDVDNGSGSGCNSNPTLSLDVTSFDCSNIGTNNVVLTATDGTNTATANAVVTVEDKIAPVITTQDVTVQLDANGNASITASQINDGSTDNCSIASMSLDKTIFSCADLGSNTVELTVVDTGGNSNTATAIVTVEDKIAPTITTQNVTVALNGNNQAIITVSNVLNTATDNCTASANLTTVLSKSTFDCTNLGANTINVEVTDANGNKAIETAVVTVNPNPNTVFAAVAKNITVELDANGQASITPQDVDNGSGSGCNSNPTLSLDVTSFDCSNIGTNNVVLTATDGTNTATANAVVTVEDKIVPTVKTQDITLQLDANGNATITVSQIDDGSTDNCSIASMSIDKTSFDTTDLGANTVELTVVDVNGNSAKRTAIVIVKPYLIIVKSPKGFSPNSDGTNDIWVIDNITYYPKNVVRLFTRSGRKVFEKTNYQNNWSGTKMDSQEQLPAGSYYYIIELNETGKKSLQGWLYISY